MTAKTETKSRTRESDDRAIGARAFYFRLSTLLLVVAPIAIVSIFLSRNMPSVSEELFVTAGLIASLTTAALWLDGSRDVRAGGRITWWGAVPPFLVAILICSHSVLWALAMAFIIIAIVAGVEIAISMRRSAERRS